ncbi:MAG: CoA pyrophosphatase [Balneolaceae bacterium]
MDRTSFFHYLKERINQPLPGREAHLRFAPSPVEGEHHFRMEAGEDAYDSSVMILLFEEQEGHPELILTLRTTSISHAGQISFPGGRSDNGETPSGTALRETREEIGVPEESIEIAGTLTKLFLDRSNNLITPVVGYLPSKPKLTINPLEVEEAFTVSLEKLMDRENFSTRSLQLSDRVYDVPYWNIHPVPLWGATAMMLSELLELYREYLEQE